LLSGVLLAGIPVLLHLIMRQKPKHLLFPAFRFLLQKHRTNQRKLQLRHLLLLALRIFLLAVACLALARPKVFSGRLSLGADQPIAAVLIIDTSYSMGFEAVGQTRLDEAKQRALELLTEASPESKLAVLDSAEPGGEWLASISLAREQINALRLRPANGTVSARLSDAYRLLADLDQQADSGTDALPRFIYVFSDRTQESWDASRRTDLEAARDRQSLPVHAVFVDVGVEAPVDVALTSFELPRQVIPSNDKLILRVTAAAIGKKCETEVILRLDGEKATDRKAVQLEPGQSQVYTFERAGLQPGFHQAEITLGTSDALAFNNVLYATFEVHGQRQVLVVVDERHDADFLKLALEAKRDFGCDVRTVGQVRDLGPLELVKYKVVCLLNVARPPGSLWDLLLHYVKDGGGLAVMPGELDLKSYNSDDLVSQILPGRFVELIQATVDAGIPWKETSYRHAVMAPFREWETNRNLDIVAVRPTVRRYWKVEPVVGASEIVVAYDDKGGSPALLDRRFPGPRPSHVLLFTTAFDRRHLTGDLPWNNYLATSFYIVIVNKTLGYLAGDAEGGSFNYRSGQVPVVPLPAAPRSPTYTLQGPNLSASESVVNHAEGQNDLTVPQARMPGNYTVLGGDGKPVASFSVNIAPEESQLNRVPIETIEDLLGQGAVLPVGHGMKFHDVLHGHWQQPLELFSWLMVLILFALAIENLLSNKFYRRESSQETNSSAPLQSAEPVVEA
jgi:hypothetical protein